MSAETFLSDLTQLLIIVIFISVAMRAITRPRKANIDTALLFGSVTVLIVETIILEVGHLKAGTDLSFIITALFLALPYLLMRLVDDVARVPRHWQLGSVVGLVASVALLIIWPRSPRPGIVTLLLVAYFVTILLYDAWAFIREARTTSGVTRRRMRAVSLGSLALALIIVIAGAQQIVPRVAGWPWHVASDILAFTWAVAYFIGFAPPLWLRRTWQEPELRAFLARASSLPRLPDTASITRALEHGAATSLGTRRAVIAVWNRTDERLEVPSAGGDVVIDALSQRAFSTQRPIFSENTTRDNPTEADLYARYGASSLLAVPITAGEQRLGVLSVYATRAPVFAEDDLNLAQLLADQAAVILESRALIDEAARVRAREETTRLKDDFLSSAAHDLRTPLTTLIAQAQLLEMKARRAPDAPADVAGIQRIAREAGRLGRLVTELLDMSRVEQGRLVGKLEEVDLSAMLRDVCAHVTSPQHHCTLHASGPLSAWVDPVRIQQLFDNLLENAVKYSPNGGAIDVRLYQDDDRAHITVTDEGIGIPPDDLPHLFDRFHRGTNVDDRRFAGMGLGLFICKGITEQHGGRLWATSAGAGGGTTFHVELPLLPAPARSETAGVGGRGAL